MCWLTHTVRKTFPASMKIKRVFLPGPGDFWKACGVMHTLVPYSGNKLQSCFFGHFPPERRITGIQSRLTLWQTDLQGRMGCGKPWPEKQNGTDLAHKKNTKSLEQFVAISASYCWKERLATIWSNWSNEFVKRVMLYGIDLHWGIEINSQSRCENVRATKWKDINLRKKLTQVENIAFFRNSPASHNSTWKCLSLCLRCSLRVESPVHLTHDKCCIYTKKHELGKQHCSMVMNNHVLRSSSSFHPT